MDVPPARHGFGMFGPHIGVPAGGFCLSVFVVVRRGDEVLVGQMAPPHETWERHWAPNLHLYSEKSLREAFKALRFPATYLRVGETPDEAALRVWRDQLRFPGAPTLAPPRVVSEALGSRTYVGEVHWDLFFVYEIDAPTEDPPTPAHWARLEYRPLDALKEDDFGMTHGGIIELIAPRPAL